MTELKQKTKKISRRDAIKLLGAAAGATVLANLPSKWSTPELASGVLPAHAQTSGLTIAGCFLFVESGINPPDDDDWVSAVQLPDGNAGIVMRYTLTFFNISFSSQFPGPQVPNPVTGTAITMGVSSIAAINSSTPGLETLVVDFPGDGSGNYSFSAVWEFDNPLDGSGSCSRSLDWTSS